MRESGAMSGARKSFSEGTKLLIIKFAVVGIISPPETVTNGAKVLNEIVAVLGVTCSRNIGVNPLTTRAALRGSTVISALTMTAGAKVVSDSSAAVLGVVVSFRLGANTPSDKVVVMGVVAIVSEGALVVSVTDCVTGITTSRSATVNEEITSVVAVGATVTFAATVAANVVRLSETGGTVTAVVTIGANVVAVRLILAGVRDWRN